MLALSPLALLLSAACGASLAGADYFRKAVPDTVSTSVMLFYFMLGQIPLMAAWHIWGPEENVRTFADLSAAYWPPGIADAIASLAGNTLFIVAVRRSPIGKVVPLLSFLPVFAIIFAAVILEEWPTVQQNLGVILTAAGVFLVYQPAGGPISPVTVWRNFRNEPGALPMLSVAVAWALTAPLDKMAMGHAGVGLHGMIQIGLLACAAAVWILMNALKAGHGWEIMRVPGPARAPIIGAALTAGLSYGLQLGAYRLTLVAFVEALKRAVEITAVVILGVVVLGEPYDRNKLIGTALIVCGVLLMAITRASN